MCSATADGIAGARIAKTFARVVGGNIMAGLDALGNGSALDEYRDDFAATRREASFQPGCGDAP
jgi:hypothetical protein